MPCVRVITLSLFAMVLSGELFATIVLCELWHYVGAVLGRDGLPRDH